MAVTLKEIAKRAGVSPSTVSHAIRGIDPGKRPLSQETVQKIRLVAEELGYRPNMLAASLAQNKTFTIGVLIASLRGNFYERILEGITEVVHPAFTPLLAVHNYDVERERRELEVFIGKRVDGVIAAFSGTTENIDLYYELQNAHKIPLVLVDRGIKGIDSLLVRSDHYQSTYMAVKSLIKLGHKRIVFGTAGRDTDSTQVFKDGYSAAMAEEGLSDHRHIVAKKTHSWSISEMKQFASEVLDYVQAAASTPTAVLLQADWLAYEVLAECELRGVKVPDDLSVMGMEDCDPSSLPAISLSTMRVELGEVGRRAAKSLLKLIEGQLIEEKKVLVAPSVIMRKTTRAI